MTCSPLPESIIYDLYRFDIAPVRKAIETAYPNAADRASRSAPFRIWVLLSEAQTFNTQFHQDNYERCKELSFAVLAILEKDQNLLQLGNRRAEFRETMKTFKRLDREIRDELGDAPDSCDHCGRAKTGETELKRCARCLVARFCSAECQKAGWARHKSLCLMRRWNL